MPDEPENEGTPSMHEIMALGDRGITHTSDLDAARAVQARLLDRHETGRPSRRFLPGISRGAGVTLGVILIGGAGVATAATGLWDPILGNDHVGEPTVSRDEVPSEQRDQFAVLARPQDAQDRSERVQRMIRFFGSNDSGVRPDSIRFVGGRREEGKLRTSILISYAERDGVKDPLCLAVSDSSSGDGNSKGCWTTQQILEGRATIGEEVPSDEPVRVRDLPNQPKDRPYRDVEIISGMPTERRIYGVVPDGTSRITWTNGRESKTAQVRNNCYSVTIPIGEKDDRDDRPTITWKNADGTPTRKFKALF